MSYTMGWPHGISDGLLLPCGVCQSTVYFDYQVDDETWLRVVPDDLRLGVVCLPCFDSMAANRGVDIGRAVQRVQFCGAARTVVLEPTAVWDVTAIPSERIA